ncbi:MAG TPA: hypothetical protein VGC07_01530 [Granulicella sp.]
MSVWKAKGKSIRLLAAGLLMMTAAGVSAHSQQTTRRRETSATRRARTQRIIADTYTRRWEVAGGGGYMRWRSGQSLQKNNEVTFWVDTAYFFNQKLGVVGGVHGAYGNAKIGNTYFNQPDNPQISEYTFMAGPEFRVYREQKSAVSLFVTGGSALGKFGGGSKGIPETELGIWPSSNAKPAFSIGANLDYNLFPNFAFRVTPAYVGTNFGDTLQNNFNLNVGLVYRFGRIH